MGIALEEKMAFTKMLWDEVEWAYRLAKEASPEQRHARLAFVRSAFAAVEGTIFAVQEWMLKARRHAPWELDRLDLNILRGKSLKLTDNGEVTFEPNRSRGPSRKARLRFLAGLAVRLAPPYTIDFGTLPGWSDFVTATEIRNAITHPASVTALELTDADVDRVYRGTRCAKEMLDTIFEKLESTTSVPVAN